jgi:hypothetical protein
MDQMFFENRDYFVKRIRELETSSTSSKKKGSAETPTETPDTAVCVRIRPLTDHEVKHEHIKGVLTDNYEVVNIHEPRRKVNSKPDLNVCYAHHVMHLMEETGSKVNCRLTVHRVSLLPWTRCMVREKHKEYL